MEEVAIGIDAGTSNSVIGVYLSGKVEIAPNSVGDTYTPSIVDILDEGEFIGEETILHKIDENNSKNRITQIKRIIGRKFSSLSTQEIEYYNAYEDPKNKDKILIKVKRKDQEIFLSPENIMSFIFKKLIKSASNFIGKIVKRAVITIPAYFDYNQRGAIVESAKNAGIDVLRIINEPTAAALAYGLGTTKNLKDSLAISMMKKDNKFNRKALVFDLGGGTFDVSILTIKDNKDFQVVASSGDTHLGGDDFDNKLVDICLNKFCIASNVDRNEIIKDKNIMRRLKIQCEKAKKKLSQLEKTSITIYNFFKDSSLFVDITRAEFDSKCEDLYERIKLVLDKVIVDSKFSLQEIDDIVVIGGSSKIPKIKTILKEKFGEKKIRDQINPDDAVAIGATWQAHKILRANKDEINIIDITPFTLGVAAKSKNIQEQKEGSIMSILIPKNKEISCKSEIKTYKTVEDNQQFFRIQLYAGEDRFCKNNDLLKEFEINNLPEGKAGTVTLKLSLEINRDGILFINAEVESIGQKIQEQYSLYERSNNENLMKTRKKIKKKEIEKLDEIKELNDMLKEKKELIITLKDNNEKLRCFKDLSEICSKLIEEYTALSEQNDLDDLYDKLFENYRRILNYYSEMILISDDEKMIEDLINKIINILSKLINDDIEFIINIFLKLKEKKPEKYILIVLHCADLLYKEGEKILDEGKKNSRYYARKYFVKADKIKSLIDKGLQNYKNLQTMKLNKELEEKYANKVGQIDSFAKALKRQIELKDTPFVKGKGSGFTTVGEIINQALDPSNAENIDLILDILSEMAESLSKDKKNVSETEAYCLVNIIKIKYSFLKNRSSSDIDIYKQLISRIEYIIERNELDEDENWIVEYNQLKEEIEKDPTEKPVPKEYLKKIEEIDNLYNNKVRKEKKPKEFLEFIIKNYPYIGHLKTRVSLNDLSCETILEEICPKYHPDNYLNRDDFVIYNEIFILLGKMKEDLLKYK